MFHRIPLIVFFLAFIGGPLPAAEEVVLTYMDAEAMPYSFSPPEPVEDEEDGWEGGTEFLANKAVTYLAYLNAGDLLDEGLLFSLGASDESASRADTLQIDCNGNRRLEKNEKYALVPLHAQAEPPILCARKIPLVVTEGKKPVLTTFFVIHFPGEGGREEMTAVGLQAWGHCKGQVTLNGESWELILTDVNVNGSFCDFESGSGDFLGADAISLKRAAEPLPAEPIPLRPKLLLGKSAYTIEVRDNGRKVILGSLDVTFSTVAAARPDIEMVMQHPAWGIQTVPAGKEHALPEGTWTIRSFRTICKETQAFCDYIGPPSVKVALLPDGKRTVELDTVFNATIKPRQTRRAIQLSLHLHTAQGACFSSFYGGVAAGKAESGELGFFLEGIPFKISDESGREVQKGIFEFG